MACEESCESSDGGSEVVEASCAPPLSEGGAPDCFSAAVALGKGANATEFTIPSMRCRDSAIT
jgi:hypothetical protein